MIFQSVWDGKSTCGFFPSSRLVDLLCYSRVSMTSNTGRSPKHFSLWIRQRVRQLSRRLVCVCWLVSSVNYANLFGIRAALHLTSTQFNWISGGTLSISLILDLSLFQACTSWVFLSRMSERLDDSNRVTLSDSILQLISSVDIEHKESLELRLVRISVKSLGLRLEPCSSLGYLYHYHGWFIPFTLFTIWFLL